MNRMNKMIRNLAGLLAIALIAASSAIPAEASNKVKAKYGIDGYTIANLPEKATLNALVDSAHKVDARAFLSLYQHDSKYLEFEGDKDQAGNTVTLQAGKRYHIMADCINYGKEDAKSVHFSLKLPQQIKAGGTSKMTAKFTASNTTQRNIKNTIKLTSDKAIKIVPVKKSLEVWPAAKEGTGSVETYSINLANMLSGQGVKVGSEKNDGILYGYQEYGLKSPEQAVGICVSLDFDVVAAK